MNTQTVQRAALAFGGAVTMMIAIGHIFLPNWGYDPTIRECMATPVQDHFYYLATYGICTFLFAFAALSLYFAWRVENSATTFISLLLAFIWVARFVLEFIYPVELSMFFLREPHPVLTSVIGATAFAYVVAALKGVFTSTIDRFTPVGSTR